jgi:predicted metalloprotease
MKFNERARLDTSQVNDRRGAKAAAIGGGGLIGIVMLVVAALAGGGGGGGTGGGLDIGGILEQLNASSVNQTEVASDIDERCLTGADANAEDDCRIIGVVNSVQEVWADLVDGYQPAPTVFFSGSVSTACGNASSAVGPFYCPADSTIYIDLGFYNDLRQRFGARGGPFAEAYVIAHEYGHHIQNLTGVLRRSQDGATGPLSGAVRVELQADCYAGVWAARAEQTGIIEDLTRADIEDGIDAAGTVGDDRIQETMGHSPDPHTFTHGSSEQRQRWFMIGYQTGNPNACDTFATDNL